MPGRQEMIPQIAHLTHFICQPVAGYDSLHRPPDAISVIFAAGSAFIASPGNKISLIRGRWARGGMMQKPA